MGKVVGFAVVVWFLLGCKSGQQDRAASGGTSGSGAVGSAIERNANPGMTTSADAAAPTAYKKAEYRLTVLKKGVLEPKPGFAWPANVAEEDDVATALVPVITSKWGGSEFDRNDLIKADFPKFREKLGVFVYHPKYETAYGEYDFGKHVFNIQMGGTSKVFFLKDDPMRPSQVLVTFVPGPYISLINNSVWLGNEPSDLPKEMNRRVLDSTGNPKDERGLWRFELSVPEEQARTFKDELQTFEPQWAVELDGIQDWKGKPYVTAHVRALRILSKKRQEVLYDSLQDQ